MADLKKNVQSFYFRAESFSTKVTKAFLRHARSSTQFWRVSIITRECGHQNRLSIVMALNWTRSIGRARCTEPASVSCRLSDGKCTVTCIKTLVFALLPFRRSPSLSLSFRLCAGEEEGVKYLYWWVTFFPTRGCLAVIRAASCDLWKCDDACFYGTLQFYKDCLLPCVFVCCSTVLKNFFSEFHSNNSANNMHDEIRQFSNAI